MIIGLLGIAWCESDAGVEDGARGVCALKVEAVEKGIGVGGLLHYPYLHAVGSLVEE